MVEPPFVYLSAETEELAAWLALATECFENLGFHVVHREDGVPNIETAAAWVYAGRLESGGDQPALPPETIAEYAAAARRGLPIAVLRAAAGGSEESPRQPDPGAPGDETVEYFDYEPVEEDGLDFFLEAAHTAAQSLAAQLDDLLHPVRRSLPPAAQHFTGREEDVAWLAGRLRAARRGARICLIGAGGTGKTAIVREALERVAEDFPGGVFMHDFYAAPSYAAFQNSILADFGAAEAPEMRDEIMHNLLGSGRTLFYAEGVEKLREHPEGGTLEPVLRACLGAVALLTSRNGLDSFGTDFRVVGVLPPEEAAALLHTHAAAERQTGMLSPAWRDLAVLMGCQPLALTLAGSLLRHSGRRPEDYADALRAAGMERVEMELRPAESLRYFFHHQAAALPMAAREVWYVLSLHGMCLTRLCTLTSCLGRPESEVQQALDALIACGISEKADLPRQRCNPPESGWRLAHPRMSEWGRSRLVDSGVSEPAIISRWKAHWLGYLDHAWRVTGIEGDCAWQDFISAHFSAFLSSLRRVSGETEEVRALLCKCARLCYSIRKSSDALGFAAEASALSVALHGRDSIETLECRITHGLAMENTTRGIGIEWLEGCLEEAVISPGPSHPVTLQARMALALLLFSREIPGEDARGVALLRENLAVQADASEELSELILFSQAGLAEHFHARQKPELLDAILELIRLQDAPGASGHRVHPAWLELAAYQKWEDKEPAESLAIYRRAEEMYADIPFTQEVLFNLRTGIVALLEEQSRWDEALAEAESLVPFASTFAAEARAFSAKAKDLRDGVMAHRLLPPEAKDPVDASSETQ